jgi:hypothetical protein
MRTASDDGAPARSCQESAIELTNSPGAMPSRWQPSMPARHREQVGPAVAGRDDGQDDVRRVRGVVQDGLGGRLAVGALAKRRAGIRVGSELRVIAAGDLDPDAVARPEQVAGRPDGDRVLVRLAGSVRVRLGRRLPKRRPNNAVVEINDFSVGPDDRQFRGEVGVGRGG